MTAPESKATPGMVDVERLARAWTRAEQGGDVWDQLHPADRQNRLDAAAAVLAAGFGDTAAVRAEALSEAADEIPAQVAVSYNVRRRIIDWLRARAESEARRG